MEIVVTVFLPWISPFHPIDSRAESEPDLRELLLSCHQDTR